MQPITLLGMGLFFGVLYYRYRTQPKNQAKVDPRRQFRTVKAVIVALLAWITLSLTLQHMIGKLDGAPDHEPSWLERAVSYLSK